MVTLTINEALAPVSTDTCADSEAAGLSVLAEKLDAIAMMAAAYRDELVRSHGFSKTAAAVLARRFLTRMQKAEVKKYCTDIQPL